MKRNIVITVTRSPYGRIHVPEGLRAAHGIAAGFDYHDVTVVFTEDGVHAAREAVDRDALDMESHIDELFEVDGRLVVDADAMADRKIAHEEVAPDIQLVSGEQLGQIIHNADHMLTI